MWLLVDITFNLQPPPQTKASDALKTKQPFNICPDAPGSALVQQDDVFRGENTTGPRLTDKPMGSDCNYGAAPVGLTQNAESAQNLSFKDIGGGLPCAQYKG